MYGSVKDFFEAEFPELAGMLENSGAFWPKVKDNTISNATLDQYCRIGGFASKVNQACIALMRGRMTGKIPNPG
jgi:hypothetical protein